MKQIILNSTVVIGLLTAPLALAAGAGGDADSEATVAAQSYDPTKEDCKCLGPKKAILPSANPAGDTRIVNWISDPAAPGEAPALPSSEAVK